MNIRKRASDLWTSLRYDGVHTDMSDTRKHVDRIAEALASVERETLEQAAKEADADGAVALANALRIMASDVSIQDSQGSPGSAETGEGSGVGSQRGIAESRGVAPAEHEQPQPPVPTQAQTAETMEDMATRVANEAMHIRSMYPSRSRGQMANEFRHFIITGALWQRAQAAPAVERKHGYCGQLENIPRGQVGCNEDFVWEGEIYRCTDCGVAMHKHCLKKHFTEGSRPIHQEGDENG